MRKDKWQDLPKTCDLVSSALVGFSIVIIKQRFIYMFEGLAIVRRLDILKLRNGWHKIQLQTCFNGSGCGVFPLRVQGEQISFLVFGGYNMFNKFEKKSLVFTTTLSDFKNSQFELLETELNCEDGFPSNMCWELSEGKTAAVGEKALHLFEGGKWVRGDVDKGEGET